MVDIRVVLAVDEVKPLLENPSVYSFIDDRQRVTPELYGIAQCEFHLHREDLLWVQPDMPELAMKKLISNSQIINEWIAPQNVLHPANFVLAVHRQHVTGGKKFFRRRPTVQVEQHEEKKQADDVLSVAFDKSTTALLRNKIIQVASGTTFDVAGVHLLQPVDTVLKYAQVGWRADHKTLSLANTWLLPHCHTGETVWQTSHPIVVGWLRNMHDLWTLATSDVGMVCEIYRLPSVVYPAKSLADFTKCESHVAQEVAASRAVARLKGYFATLSSLYVAGLSLLLPLEKQLGPDSAPVNNLVEAYNAQVARHRTHHEQVAIKARKLQEETIIRAIIHDKFGKDRAASRSRTLVDYNARVHVSTLLAGLTAQERHLVETERKQQADKVNADPKCPHRAAIRSMFRASKTHASTKIILDAVANVRGFAIKAHTKEPSMLHCSRCKGYLCCPHTLLFIESSANNTKLTDVYRTFLPFVIKRGRQHFCKVCGEQLSSDVFLDTSNIHNQSDLQNEELRGRIISELYGLLRFLKFSELINVRSFIGKVCDAIYSLVQETERQIDKSRMSTVEESEAKAKVFTCIYGVAYVMIVAQKASFVQFRAAKGAKLDPAGLITVAVNTVVISKNIQIGRIRGLTPNIIKAKMIDAYKILSGAAGQITRDDFHVATEQFNVSCDPVYWAIARAWYIAQKQQKSPAAKKYDLTPHAANLQLAKELLGGDKSGYGGVKAVSLEACSRQDTDFVKAYKAMLTIAQMKPHWLYDNIGTGDTLVARRAVWYDEAMLRKEERDAAIRASRRHAMCLSASPCASYKRGERSQLMPISLGYTYDVRGKLHEWRLDKCTICEMAKKDAILVPEKSILDTLRKNNKIRDLFLFFENRCPEAFHHTLSHGKCTLCGLHDISDDDYYAKYVTKFDASRVISLPVSAKLPAPYQPEPMQFTFDFAHVVNFCKKAGVNRYQMIALGASERATKEAIYDGSYTPAETFEKITTRINVLAAYIRTTYIVYNQVRRYYSIQKPPEDIMKFVAAAKITEESTVKMTTIPNTFPEDFRRALVQLKPRHTVEYCLTRLCDVLSQVWDVARSVAEFILAKIFRAEELSSKHGAFNKVLVYGSVTSKETTGAEDATEDDAEGATTADTEAADDPFDAGFDLEEEEPEIVGDEDTTRLKFGDESGLD